MPEILISKHAKVQIRERRLTEELLMAILDNPDQTIHEDDEKVIYQSIGNLNPNKRVFL